MATTILIGIYAAIVYLFFRLVQFYEKREQKKEEQKKMWETLSDGYILNCDPVDIHVVPRRRYRK